RILRDQQMNEVDLVLERDDGMVVGIEVKSSATVVRPTSRAAESKRDPVLCKCALWLAKMSTKLRKLLFHATHQRERLHPLADVCGEIAGNHFLDAFHLLR